MASLLRDISPIAFIVFALVALLLGASDVFIGAALFVWFLVAAVVITLLDN